MPVLMRVEGQVDVAQPARVDRRGAHALVVAPGELGDAPGRRARRRRRARPPGRAVRTESRRRCAARGNWTLCPPTQRVWPGREGDLGACVAKETDETIPTVASTTPRCTTIPPEDRPSSPRHVRRAALAGRAEVAAERAQRRPGGDDGEEVRDERAERRAHRRPRGPRRAPVPANALTRTRRHTTQPSTWRQPEDRGDRHEEEHAQGDGDRDRVEVGGPDGHRRVLDRLVREREDGPEQDDGGEADEQHVVRDERALAADRLVDRRPASGAGRRARRAARGPRRRRARRSRAGSARASTS